MNFSILSTEKTTQKKRVSEVSSTSFSLDEKCNADKFKKASVYAAIRMRCLFVDKFNKDHLDSQIKPLKPSKEKKRKKEKKPKTKTSSFERTLISDNRYQSKKSIRNDPFYL